MTIRRGSLLTVPTVALLLACSAGRAWAQAEEATPLAMGDRYEWTLGAGEERSFSLELAADQFVIGTADQVSVDVVVTVVGPDGEEIGRFDGPASGWEVFRFESDEAGVYTVRVSPFEDGAGAVAVSLILSEPIADEPGERVKQLVAVYDLPGMPGGAIAVVDDGEVIFSHAFGLANLAYEIPFTLDTPTNIGSTSKQFTAFAICLLVERGEVSLDDDIRTYIPELPEFDQAVTIRHLLTHTSGYREFLNALLLAGRRLDRGDSIDREELIAIVQRQPELQNEPGAEWNYNNTAFGLLAEVVARVTGEPFDVWVKGNIFEPLGMDDSVVKASQDQIIAGAAMGYAPAEGGGFRNSRDLGASMGAGGIYASVNDLVKWMNNYRSPTVGSTRVVDLMTTKYVLNSGRETNYGFGLFLDEQRGLERIQHGGADSAHRSQFVYYPEIDAGVIVQSNNATFAADVAFDIAERFFGDEMEAEGAAEEAEVAAADGEEDAFDAASFDAESFDRFAGRYELEEVPGFVMTFSREGEDLFVQATRQPKLAIEPVSATRFRIQRVNAEVEFVVADDGSVPSLMLHQNGEHPAKRLGEEPWSPSAEELEAYAGRYFSEELEAFYTVSVEEGKLMIAHRRFEPGELKAGEKDRFTGPMPVAQVAFERDDEGRVTGLIVGNGRVRGIRFERWEGVGR